MEERIRPNRSRPRINRAHSLRILVRLPTRTEHAIPCIAVVSGSMCIPYDGSCDGWSHPFDRTLHIGDLIIVQGVNPADLNTNYPNSDIIVFHKPGDPNELIVHRIVSASEVNGKLYFRTKGDGNTDDKWPSPPRILDPWMEGDTPGVSQDHVVGKVIMRIPYLGHVVLFMRNSVGLFLVVALVILLIVLEFVIPIIRGKKPTNTSPEPQNNPATTQTYSQNQAESRAILHPFHLLPFTSALKCKIGYCLIPPAPEPIKKKNCF